MSLTDQAQAALKRHFFSSEFLALQTILVAGCLMVWKVQTDQGQVLGGALIGAYIPAFREYMRSRMDTKERALRKAEGTPAIVPIIPGNADESPKP